MQSYFEEFTGKYARERSDAARDSFLSDMLSMLRRLQTKGLTKDKSHEKSKDGKRMLDSQ